MTLLEKFKMDNPTAPLSKTDGTPDLCPSWVGYTRQNGCVRNALGNSNCKACWNQEYVESESVTEPHILDSGDRTEFETGAVRDMREGKGRCDLLPLDVVADYIKIQKESDNMLDTLKRSNIHTIINYIREFTESGNTVKLFWALTRFDRFCDAETMILEVAKHFEEGAKKYGDNNWQKGIPVRCYIDSAIRHYLKYLRGDEDEPHDRAFCWNILCAIWTCKHKPELNDYAKKDGE